MNRWTAISLCFFFSAVGALSCQSEIGDGCRYDVDCSPNGDRNCDNGQPGGYCLIITCSPGTCPSEASCVEFLTPSPDFSAEDEEVFTAAAPMYDALNPNRARTYCLQRCKKNSDCRGGYHCARDDELAQSLHASIAEYNAKGGVCVPGKSAPKDAEDADTDTDTDTGAPSPDNPSADDTGAP
ncbi:MAG: hypothetical protein GX146_11760 [Myxococcales bacterium]|nr:hypothetical protein [Myxococcales bacterium]